MGGGGGGEHPCVHAVSIQPDSQGAAAVSLSLTVVSAGPLEVDLCRADVEMLLPKYLFVVCLAHMQDSEVWSTVTLNFTSLEDECRNLQLETGSAAEQQIVLSACKYVQLIYLCADCPDALSFGCLYVINSSNPNQHLSWLPLAGPKPQF